jgi:N-sulfoglucosamine sulfohydrolase
VKNYIQRPTFELYDLEKDPHEVHNLAGESAHAKLLADMKARLKSFQQQTADPWVLKWDYE